ncbi:unnamed protein product [Heterobilharzia americana]|nr:unnamed protein product [Heterobilharzia americana]
MCIPNDIFLPCDLVEWNKIKCALLSVIQNRRSLVETFQILNEVEGSLHSPLKQVGHLKAWSANSTYVGLGNFIELCMNPEERAYFESYIMPFIINSVVIIENLVREHRPSYCLQNQKCSRSIRYDISTSIVASSFLCLLPIHPQFGQWMGDINFTVIYVNIVIGSMQTDKLRCVISYFDHCRTSKLSPSEGLIISRRVWSCLDDILLSLSEALPNALSCARLPYLLIDNTSGSDQLARDAGLPMVHFMGSRVGGEFMGCGISQTESLFSRYPDLISIIPLCQHLNDGESIWIDHLRGPFFPEALGDSIKTDRISQEGVKWSRLILLNSNQYPAWLSEIQYFKQCLVSDITLVSAGLFPGELEYCDEIIRPGLFTSSWWDYLLGSKSTSRIPSQYTKNRSISSSSNLSVFLTDSTMKCVQTKMASDIIHFADKLILAIMYNSENKITRIKGNKSSYCRSETIHQKSQIHADKSIQHTLNVVKPLNITELDERRCKNVVESNPPQYNPRSFEINGSNHSTFIKHREFEKPDVYCYADDLVEESVKCAQNLSILHTHHLHTYADKLVSNVFKDISKLMKWSNQLSKQLLTEAKYSKIEDKNNTKNNHDCSYVHSMDSITDTVNTEYNKTNTDTDKKEDYSQYQIHQQNIGSCSQSTHSMKKCFKIKNSSPMEIIKQPYTIMQSVKDKTESYDDDKFLVTSSTTCNDQLLTINVDHKKFVSRQHDSTIYRLPHIFVSKKLSEFVNSLVVRCITLSIGEIYVQRMSSYLNHCSMNSNSDDDNHKNNNDPETAVSNQYNSSNIRPPGLILDAGVEKYPSNYYSDPQMKILIQWISAALIYNSPCSKINFLMNKMNSTFDKNADKDTSREYLTNKLKELKDQISVEHSCSPLICCTNGDEKLKGLQTVVSLVYEASWNAKDLFYAMLDYCHYRSQYLAHTTTCSTTGTTLSSQSMTVSEEKSKSLLSLFDYLIFRLRKNHSILE